MDLPVGVVLTVGAGGPAPFARSGYAWAMPRYFAHTKKPGPLLWGELHCALGVLAAPDQHMPIGAAFPEGWDSEHRATFKLVVGKQDLPGFWVVVDGVFIPITGEHKPTAKAD